MKDVRIAVLDSKGCAIAEQGITGTLSKPSLKMDEATVETLSNVAFLLLSKSKSSQKNNPLVRDENCTIFYEGIVKHPENKTN